MMVKRSLQQYLLDTAKAFRVVTITGPRQCGKTTLAQMCFPDYVSFDLDDPVIRLQAQTDHRQLLNPTTERFFIDEFQRVPELLSRIKVIVDEVQEPGQFILTGSNQFEHMHQIAQSLAGRTALLKLYPFSYQEMYGGAKQDLFKALQRGFYPALFNALVDTATFYNSYVGTYLERDLRNLSLVRDLSQFRLFLKLCAGRSGTELNRSKLASDAGIDLKTASHWLSLIQTSGLITFLQPYHHNWKKRLIKSPKLYFLDTGLLCFLLGISDHRTLISHPLRGNIFETFVVTEVIKYYANQGRFVSLSFLKETNGIELDLIIENDNRLIPMEIKSGMTFNLSWLDNIRQAQSADPRFGAGAVIYSGEEEFSLKGTQIVNAGNLNELLPGLFDPLPRSADE